MSQLDAIIEVLKRVPEKKLLIIELANQIPLRYGDFNADFLKGIQERVSLAMAEAKEYSRHTEHAVEQIIRIPGDSGDIYVG